MLKDKLFVVQTRKVIRWIKGLKLRWDHNSDGLKPIATLELPPIEGNIQEIVDSG
ncbi:MAG: hypothetical protein LBP87_08770 [Planctomycetaceae bacterium]|nr:hypothetical protein [Planctomycetaceae bacterium]